MPRTDGTAGPGNTHRPYSRPGRGGRLQYPRWAEKHERHDTGRFCMMANYAESGPTATIPSHSKDNRANWPGAKVDAADLASTLTRCRAASRHDPGAATVISLVPEKRRTAVTISMVTAEWEIEETLKAKSCGPKPAARRDLVLSARGAGLLIRSAQGRLPLPSAEGPSTPENTIEIRTPDTPVPALQDQRISAAAKLPDGGWLLWRAAPLPDETAESPRKLFTVRTLVFRTTLAELIAALRDRGGTDDVTLVYSDPRRIEIRDNRRRPKAAATLTPTGDVRHDGAGAWRLLNPGLIARWLRAGPPGNTQATVILYETRSHEDAGHLEQNVLLQLSPKKTACALTLRPRNRKPL